MDKSPKILDLGCGKNKVKDAIGVDNVALATVDIVHDLRNFPYPFEDNSIDKIYCRHVLEHFDSDSRNKVLEEIYRILKIGGELEIRVPHVYSIAVFQDPTHKSYYSFKTILYFTQNYKYSYYKANKVKFILQKTWVNLDFFAYVNSFLSSWINVQTTWVFNKVFNFTGNLPDILIKILPIYHAEILWVLEKT